MDTSNWTHDDYKAFALTYAAYIDSDFTVEERESIIHEVGGDRAKMIDRLGKNLSDYECLQLLQKERERFYPGANGKTELLGELKSLFKTDGDFSQLEKVVLHHLERLL
jgi:hypothetical protein